jgi:hypothetical protein
MLPEAVSTDGIAPAKKLDPLLDVPEEDVHPGPELLERFVRGDLTGARGRAQCRTIVRHLLAGCPHCTRITRRLWALGDFP